MRAEAPWSIAVFFATQYLMRRLLLLCFFRLKNDNKATFMTITVCLPTYKRATTNDIRSVVGKAIRLKIDPVTIMITTAHLFYGCVPALKNFDLESRHRYLVSSHFWDLGVGSISAVLHHKSEHRISV